MHSFCLLQQANQSLSFPVIREVLAVERDSDASSHQAWRRPYVANGNTAQFQNDRANSCFRLANLVTCGRSAFVRPTLPLINAEKLSLIGSSYRSLGFSAINSISASLKCCTPVTWLSDAYHISGKTSSADFCSRIGTKSSRNRSRSCFFRIVSRSGILMSARCARPGG